MCECIVGVGIVVVGVGVLECADMEIDMDATSEAVALMFGMEPNYLSTRRMCFEGQMVQLMAQYDFKKIKPDDIYLVCIHA